MTTKEIKYIEDNNWNFQHSTKVKKFEVLLHKKTLLELIAKGQDGKIFNNTVIHYFVHKKIGQHLYVFNDCYYKRYYFVHDFCRNIVLITYNFEYVKNYTDKPKYKYPLPVLNE